jgi:ribosome-associated protein
MQQHNKRRTSIDKVNNLVTRQKYYCTRTPLVVGDISVVLVKGFVITAVVVLIFMIKIGNCSIVFRHPQALRIMSSRITNFLSIVNAWTMKTSTPKHRTMRLPSYTYGRNRFLTATTTTGTMSHNNHNEKFRLRERFDHDSSIATTTRCGMRHSRPWQSLGYYHTNDSICTLQLLPKMTIPTVRFFATNEFVIDQADVDNCDDDDDDDDNDVTDDRDLYEYDTKESSQWMVPGKIIIPEDQVMMRFTRSSGAGGQNVNKVSSCVQVRFHVLSADWIGPLEVRQRFQQAYRNSINSDGIYRIESQVYRTQTENRKDVMKKLEAAVLAAWPRPKERKLRVGLTANGKRKRREDKEKHSLKKQGRQNYRF